MRALIPGISAGMLGRGRARSVPNPALSFPIFPLFQGGEALLEGIALEQGWEISSHPWDIPGLAGLGAGSLPTGGNPAPGKIPGKERKVWKIRARPPPPCGSNPCGISFPILGFSGRLRWGEDLGKARLCSDSPDNPEKPSRLFPGIEIPWKSPATPA